MINQYFKEIEDKVRVCYSLAEESRKKGLDPLDTVEIPIARSLAEKVVGLIGVVYPQIKDEKIVSRIIELEKEYGQLDSAVSFKIAEEIAREKFCKFESLLQAIEAGIRVGFAYNTLGVVSSPIEGFTELKLGKTKEGKDYFVPYFSGPIRSAGTTAACMVLILIDYLRETFGYAKYDPEEVEVKRTAIEVFEYHERITNLQYLPTEEEALFLARNIPIQISGEPSEEREVPNYKDLPRMNTNFIRGGMCLVFAEGLAQKAQKGLRILKGLQARGFKISDWQFLEEYVKLHKKREKGTADTSPAYIKDLVAGRPVFGHPARSGGFRFRYGRSRTGGFSATSIHPATMAISNGFLSTGTQLKIEKPTKGCIVTACNKMDGPIVKLKNGSVKQINDFEEAKKIYSQIQEIIYLGDILFSFGDVLNRNYELIKPGYCEEWWDLELKKALHDESKKITIDHKNIDIEKALEISKENNIPLHPRFIFYWSQISTEQFIELLKWLNIAKVDEKIILPFYISEQEKVMSAKRALELLAVPHTLSTEFVVIDKNDSKALLTNLGIDFYLSTQDQDIFHRKIKEVREKAEQMFKEGERDILFFINTFSKVKIKDKAGTFIGARMGRPEKAKLRKLTGNPHVLFPVGEEGGRMRSVQEASETEGVKADFPIYICENCRKETIYYICETCGSKCKKMNYCPICERIITGHCPEHGGLETKKIKGYMPKRIDIKHYLDSAIKYLELNKGDIPSLIKGVRGTSSESHIPENIAKGILRAKYGLAVNKDGTIRYDGTEAPITHFKLKEIQISIEKLKELGYLKDIYGDDLENEDQILELKPHDIILPACPDTLDEKGDDVFVKIAKFIDELLVRFYKLKPFYNVQTRDDLIGHLVALISPHNCACVVGRILGFSKTQTIFASPYVHAACRRDCDGDEFAVMLLLDTLLNFSRQFLPGHRGGTQDAPLVLNARIRAGEVDDQILDFETTSLYPLELYELAEQGHHSSEVKIETVRQRLAKGIDPFTNIGFTHETEDFNKSITNSSYKTIPNMAEKVRAQMELAEKIRAVDMDDVARLIIERHFIRDIKGNLRKFSMQQFRCVQCNSKYRRPPLVGKCLKCGGRIIFTIAEGSISKYLEPALQLAEKYNLSDYIKQSLELTKKYIESVFGREEEKQEALAKWF